MVLYSHDTQGLGHIRRNIAIAAALVAADPGTNVLLLTGAPEATALPLPPRTEVLTLPTLHKDVAGAYTSRVLDTPLADVLAMRSSLVCAAVLSFRPELLIVDKVPRGVHGELDDVLCALLVPRVRPRLEQLVRARRLAGLGLVGVLEPDRATPAAIGEWLAAALAAGPPGPGRFPVDLDGLAVVPRLARELVARRGSTHHAMHHALHPAHEEGLRVAV